MPGICCALWGEKPKELMFFLGKVNIGISGLFLFLCIVRLLASSGKLTLSPKLRFTCKFPCGRHQSENATPGETPFQKSRKMRFLLPFSAVKKSTSGKKATPPYPPPLSIHGHHRWRRSNPLSRGEGGRELIIWARVNVVSPSPSLLGLFPPLLCCVGRVCMWAGDRGDQSAAENDQDSIVVVSRYI